MSSDVPMLFVGVDGKRNFLYIPVPTCEGGLQEYFNESRYINFGRMRVIPYKCPESVEDIFTGNECERVLRERLILRVSGNRLRHERWYLDGGLISERDSKEGETYA